MAYHFLLLFSVFFAHVIQNRKKERCWLGCFIGCIRIYCVQSLICLLYLTFLPWLQRKLLTYVDAFISLFLLLSSLLFLSLTTHIKILYFIYQGFLPLSACFGIDDHTKKKMADAIFLSQENAIALLKELGKLFFGFIAVITTVLGHKIFAAWVLPRKHEKSKSQESKEWQISLQVCFLYLGIELIPRIGWSHPLTNGYHAALFCLNKRKGRKMKGIRLTLTWAINIIIRSYPSFLFPLHCSLEKTKNWKPVPSEYNAS